MAKILCGISGIEFNCDHLPLYLNSREYYHPVFCLPQRKLLGLYQKYRHNELNEIDSYLLFLAYLNSTDLIEWRVPAKRLPLTASIIAQNFESLVHTVERMNLIKNPSTKFVHIAVSPDTCSLNNVHYWILNWQDTLEDFASGHKNQRYKLDLAELEEKLAFISKDANRSEVQYASRLADWAEKAAEFPRYEVTVGGQVIPVNQYWKLIIRKCTSAESVLSINEEALQDVRDFCETNIDVSSLYYHDLITFLKEAEKKKQAFLGFGDFNWSFVEADTSVEQANKQAIISNAPTEAPSRLQYPSTFSYLKAKMNWEMAQSHAAATAQIPAHNTQEETGEL